MESYRRSRSQSRLPSQLSPGYREYDNSAYDYFFDRPLEKSHRSRSLDNRRDLNYDEYGTDGDGFDHSNPSHSAIPKRNYEYQPYLNVNTQFIPEQRYYYDDTYLDRMSPLDFRCRQPYSPKSVQDNEWFVLDHSIRNYRDDSDVYPNRRINPFPKVHGVSPRSAASQKKHIFGNLFSDDRHSSKFARGPVNSRSPDTIPKSEAMRNHAYGPGPDEIDPKVIGSRVEGQPGVGVNSSYSHQRNYNRSYGASGPYVGRQLPSGKGSERRIIAGHYGPGEQKFYKIHCCCLSFRWPPWRCEEVDPPQPMYRHQ